MKASNGRATWAKLADGRPVTLAVDTEFQGAETLTIQFAVRAPDGVRVQLYHSPDIPPPPRGCFRRSFAADLPGRVRVLAPKPITADLSPAGVLADLLGLPPAKLLSRTDGEALPPRGGRRGGAGRAAETPRPEAVAVRLVGHFLRADLLRAFGRNFTDGLLAPTDRPPAVALRDGRVVGFAGTGGVADRYADPVVEYVAAGGGVYEVRLGTVDTNCVCGPATLDALARAYVGGGKGGGIADTDKGRMKAVFRDRRRAAAAYRYAARDAALTLLIAERMHEQHADLYAAFGVPPGDTPPMHGTPGLRVANLILHHARHGAAVGARRLGAAEAGGPASLARVKELARRGSAGALADGRFSRYGPQTGGTHGGILHSRSPTTFFHEAPGQFRDLDLKSCYPAIIRGMTVYLGRPVVFEPGHTPWTLKRAVEYLTRHADGEYAWFVKASGPLGGFPNTLVPSTVDGLTNDNHRKRAARKANVETFDGKGGDPAWGGGDRRYAALFTDEVNAGVVTWATWLMIQALPPAARSQYEGLRAESLVFYPRKLAAGSGAEFDELVRTYRKGGHAVDWRQELDLADGGMTRTTVEDIDESYVSLRYPVGELAGRLVELREGAGPDSAAGRLYKTLANTVYGAFASPFLPTSNPVAANVITGTARALAYAMTQALNAHLVVTDGVLYRRDRVPADTYAARLRRDRDYPLVHSSGGPFTPTTDVPAGDEEFTRWYVAHALRFFGVAGRPAYEALFGLHALAHKRLPGGGAAFDGVFLDGGANYAKLVQAAGGGWEVAEMKARAFRREEKEGLKDWLLGVYRDDNYPDRRRPLPPAGSWASATRWPRRVGRWPATRGPRPSCRSGTASRPGRRTG